MIYHHEKKIAKIFHGDREISRVYRGERLVYQNKLIPGVDYEKYQWLINEGNAILSLCDINDFKNISFDFKKHAGSGYCGFFLAGVAENSREIQLTLAREGFLYSYIGYNTPVQKRWGSILSVNHFELIRKNIDEYKMTVNGNTEEFKKNNNYLGEIKINNQPSYNTNIQSGWKNCVFEDKSKHILNPIQLLRDIPAFMASNNRPHPAGECGMIDEISGKFYGNANSSGAFSVSND